MSSRHFGLSAGTASAYLEALRVSLDRHHVPSVELVITDNGAEHAAALAWPPASPKEKAAWNNKDDATRDGAYCLAIATLELVRDLVAIGRAETKTGADYYLGPKGSTFSDLENAIRLEVSGIDQGSHSMVMTRLKQKLDQAKSGISNLPAIAVVVEYSSPSTHSADVL